jgi:hypothetical protein
LGVLPPLAVRGILDHAIPNGDLRLLWLLVGIIIGLKILFGLIRCAAELRQCTGWGRHRLRSAE